MEVSEQLKRCCFQIGFMLAAIALIQILSAFINDFSLLVFCFFAAICAVPIWIYKSEYFLYVHQSVLKRTLKDGSKVKGLIWKANIRKSLFFLIACAYAILLLLISPLFELHLWATLYIGAVLAPLYLHLRSTLLINEVNEHATGLISRRATHYVMLSLLVLIIATLEFYFVGVEDFRGTDVVDLFVDTLKSHQLQSNSTVVGFGVGVFAGINACSWLLMQTITPDLPDVALKLLAWLLFLVPAALSALLIVNFQLGILSFWEMKQTKNWKFLGETITSKSFIGTLTVLFAFTLYGIYAIAKIDFGEISVKLATAAPDITLCSQDTIKGYRKSIASDLNQYVTAQRGETNQKVNQQIDEAVEQAFSTSEQGIDSYLDWFYTVGGEYQRLMAAGAQYALDDGRFTQLMGLKAKEHIVDGMRIGETIDELDITLNKTIRSDYSELALRLNSSARDLSKVDKCSSYSDGDTIDTFQSELEHGFAGSGVIGAALTRVGGQASVKQVATSAVGKSISKGAGKSLANLATKLLAKKAATSLGIASAAGTGATAGALVGGPVGAAVGGVIMASVAWFGIDKVAVEIEESLYRDEKKAELMVLLEAQKEQLRTSLEQHYLARITRVERYLTETINQSFVPARDGV